MKRWIDRLFVLALFAFLLVSFGRAALSPREINAYENRPASQFAELTPDAFGDGSFQDAAEDALADQVPLAQSMKRAYNVAQSSLEKAFLDPILAAKPRRYIRYKDLNIFAGEYLLYDVRPLDTIAEALDARRENLRRVIAAHPELDFYTFFIEKDTEVNYETGENSRAGLYFLNGTPTPMDNFDDWLLPMDRQTGLAAPTFEDYAAHFFKTDHHWNHRGAYAGYGQVCALLGIPEEERLSPGEEVLVSPAFFGSKAKTLGTESFTEDFFAYLYEYPDMTIAVNGRPAADYGRQAEFLAGSAEVPLTYAAFYGDDVGEVSFDTGRSGRGNLLVLGDSYDNALLKLLASHFNRTYAVDLRYYEQQMGEPFSFGAYTKAHEIDRVLFFGSEAYYISEDFAVSD